ncbi:MAG: DUF4372 domain-containing protein [Proteobacteria bacterium]|nr:DUF4372 domain-containing protein [Pseudomonadota bacterium]
MTIVQKRIGKWATKHNSERHSRGFRTWDQFVSMLFCQRAQAKILKEIYRGLSCWMEKLRHIGIGCSPRKVYAIICE